MLRRRESVHDFDEFKDNMKEYNARIAEYALRLIILEAKMAALDANNTKTQTRLSALTTQIKNFNKNNEK